jgi:hypothetical protein
MASTIRRLSCIPEAIQQAIKDETSLQVPKCLDRRPSLQEIEDSALLFLERRKSSDSGIGSLQPDLYRKRGSIVTIGSNKDGLNCPARIQLQLDYDFQKSDFLVTILEASTNLPSSTASDDFELWLSLNGEQRRLICPINCDRPLSKEEFKFPTTYDELLEKNLIIELVSTENSGFTIIKHARTKLVLSELRPSDDLILWIDLEPVHEKENRSGELNICLQYLSSAQRLSLSIQQATGLHRSNGENSAPSALVKAVLTFDGKILKKKKTTIKKNCICPIWNEVLTFEVDPRLISKCKMDLIVIDSCGAKVLGSANLGENAGHGARIWKEALRGQSKVSRWLPLVAGPPSR